MAAKRRLSFNLVAVSRFDEMRAYKEQDDLRPIQAPIDLIAPFGAWRNLTIVPL
jgi:hypothetical protein